ncbi:hypothetical protein RSOL_511460, partial [Rhizoctonia solani AG-3 Rhs1AP]
MLPSNVCIAEPVDPEPDTLMEPQEWRTPPRRHEEVTDMDVAESGSGPTDSSIDAPRYSGESSANQFKDVSVVNAFKPHHLSTNNTPSEHSKTFLLNQPHVNPYRFGADHSISSSAYNLPEPSSDSISAGHSDFDSSAILHATNALNIVSTHDDLPPASSSSGHSDLYPPCVPPTTTSTTPQTAAETSISSPANAEPCSITLNVQRPTDYDNQGCFSGNPSSLSNEDSYHHGFKWGGDGDDGGSDLEQCRDSQQDDEIEEDNGFEKDDKFEDDSVEEGDDFELLYHDILQDGNEIKGNKKFRKDGKVKPTKCKEGIVPRNIMFNLIRELTRSGKDTPSLSYGVFEFLVPKPVFGPNCERVKERLEIYMAVGLKRRCAVPMVAADENTTAHARVSGGKGHGAGWPIVNDTALTIGEERDDLNITRALITDPGTPEYLRPDLEKMLELKVTVEANTLAVKRPGLYYHIIMSGMQSLATSPQVELAPFYQPVEPLFTLDTLEEISMFDLQVLGPDEKHSNCTRFHFLSDGQIVGNRLLTLYPDGSVTIRNGNTRRDRHFSQKELEGHAKPEDVEALASSYQSLLGIADRSSCESRKKVFYDCIERLTKVATVIVKHRLPTDALEEAFRPSHKDLAKAELLAHFLLGHCISVQLCPVCKKPYGRLASSTTHLIDSTYCMREASKMPPGDAPTSIDSQHPGKRWCPILGCKKQEFQSPSAFENH